MERKVHNISDIEEKYKNIMKKIDRRPTKTGDENEPMDMNSAHHRLEDQDQRVKKDGNPD